MEKALSYVLSAIVDNPDSLTITSSEEEGITTYTIAVPKEEMGKVIGKGGKIIRAIRQVMKIPAMKQNIRINISLVEKT